MAPSVLDGALLGVSHPMLDLGECLLDGIEVGRVFGQEPQPGSGIFDGIADGLALVGSEIVHDDDVAGLEGWNQRLVDIGAETFAVDRAVEDTGCGEPVASKRTEECQSAPAAARGEAPQSGAFRPPTAQRCHVGSDPGLIDEDQPVRIEAALPGLPAPPSAGDVSSAALNRNQRFF